MEFFEIKYLTAWPGVWIRPHTADNNQVMKIHLGLQNPGGKFYMRAGNDTVHWQAGKAHLFDDSYLHEVNGTAVEGDGPRVVLDIKFTHPDLHRTRGLGTFTSMPQWHKARAKAGAGGEAAAPPEMDINTRVPDLTNQLIEKLGALDGDSGRTSQSAFMAVMNKYGDAHMHTLCADLGLDVRGNEMRGGTVTMDPTNFNEPPGKRECLRRLMKLWEEAGFDYYRGSHDGDVMEKDLKRWLSGVTDKVPTAWVEVRGVGEGEEEDVSDMDYGVSEDPRLLGNTCVGHDHCAKTAFCEPPVDAEQHEGGHCHVCRRCKGRDHCKLRCKGKEHMGSREDAPSAQGSEQAAAGAGEQGGGKGEEQQDEEEELREDEDEGGGKDEL
jgi:hypothetical protein